MLCSSQSWHHSENCSLICRPDCQIRPWPSPRRHAVLHNLRTDTKVLEFANAAGVGMAADVSLVTDRSGARATGGACTAISFRTGAHGRRPSRHKNIKMWCPL